MLRRFVGNITFNECHDKLASEALYERIAKNMSWQDRFAWMEPAGVAGGFKGAGSFRSASVVKVPCDTRAWADGAWQAVPMPYHCCNKDVGISKCPSSIMETPSHCRSIADGLSYKCSDDATLLCPDFFKQSKSSDCLVYSFGIANAWEFEDWAGHQGCETHAFDPTEKYLKVHEAHKSPNVTFHYKGLSNGKNTSSASVHLNHNSYGKLGGTFYALEDLLASNNHLATKRNINVLKIDCEGCEWEAFVQIAEETPDVLKRVCTIVLEVHFSETLQVKTPHQLKLIAKFWYQYIEVLGYRLWYFHPNPGGYTDRAIHPELAKLGLDKDICCYEIGLYLPGCE